MVTPIWTLVVAGITGLVAAPAHADCTLFTDDFDGYVPGFLIPQSDWEAWNNDPGAAEAEVTADQARSDPHAVAVDGADDLVRRHSGATTGGWEYVAWQFVPDDFSGQSFFILLNTYVPLGETNWSLQVFADSATGMFRDRDGPAALPLVTGDWAEIRVVIDLDADVQSVFYDGEFMLSKSWTDGVTGDGALDIAAVDLYGNGATPVYYDDLSLVRTGDTDPTIERTDVRQAANEKDHRTDRYKNDDLLIVRRGQTIDVDVIVTGPFDPDVHRVSFEARHTFDEEPVTIEIPDVKNLPRGAWATTRLGVADAGDGRKRVAMRINVPADAAIGRYRFFAVMTGCRKEFPKRVVILFNPWSQDDQVHDAEEARRKEYVLAADGIVYMVEQRPPFRRVPKRWRFAQFNTVSLDVMLDALDELDAEERSNAIDVSRRLAKATRETGGVGILVGNWDHRPPADGTAPIKWSGSDQILKKYAATGAPVKYAQCWGFGGVTNTLLRAAGIPSRPVTTYVSGHDTDGNKTIDYYLDVVGRLDRARTTDSEWLFHVWCDAWMKRPDRQNADGWQAVDGTYRIGPAPVAAVKANAGGDYDVDFVFAEVDADVVYRRNDGTGNFRFARRDQKHIGRYVVTKKAGANESDDVTASYKTPEHPSPPGGGGDVLFQVAPTRLVDIGEDVVWSLSMESVAGEARTMDVTMTASAVAYNGMFIADVTELLTTVVLAPGERRVVELRVTEDEYLPWLDARALEFTTAAEARETGEGFADLDRATLLFPSLAVSLDPPGFARVGDAAELTVSFTNPLPFAMTGATLALAVGEELEIDGEQEVEIELGAIGPGEEITVARGVVALEVGEFPIAAVLLSEEMNGVSGDAGLGAVIAADVNRDGRVDFGDLLTLLAVWGACEPPPDPCPGDVNGNGFVDFADVLEVLANWGWTLPI